MMKIYSSKTVNKLNRKLKLLGNRANFSALFFLNIRTITSIIIFFVLLYIPDWGFIISPIFTYLYYKLVYYLFIDLEIEKRIHDLEFDALQYFEVVNLGLQSNKDITSSIRIACSNVDNELSDEFKIFLNEIDHGKGFKDSLDSLRERMPSDIINSILLNISQSFELGNNISKDIDEQIDFLRDKEVGRIKAIISKIPLKVSVISVLFYIPLILLLVLTPVVIEFLK